jgi:hypothetical protein
MKTFKNVMKGLAALVVIFTALGAIISHENTASAPAAPSGATGRAGCQIIADAIGYDDGSLTRDNCRGFRQEVLNRAKGDKADATEKCVVANIMLRVTQQQMEHGVTHMSPGMFERLTKETPKDVTDNVLKGCSMLIFDVSEQEFELARERTRSKRGSSAPEE